MREQMKKEKQEKANTMKEQKGDSGSGIDESVMLGLMGELSSSLRPYKDSHKIHDKIPKQGRKREDIIKIMEEMYAKEEKKWKDGYVSGAVYHGDEEHINFLNKIYAINSQSNPLHMDLWPSASKFEAEIVAMTANMMNGGPSSDDPEKNVCGSVTSGGTESILVAMKTYRDWARETKGITKPEMIAPVTAHAAFDKASQYFNIKMVHIPMDENYQADVEAARKA
ncbi:hypothetical protein KKA14_07850, partial [bacterium]|nr:hypothetical protein [bacterium]